MAEEIPLEGLTTDQLLVQTVTVLNALVREQQTITGAFKKAANLHWTCVFFPGRDGEGPRIVKVVQDIQAELADTKAYLNGLKRGIWLSLSAMGTLTLSGQFGLDLKAILSLLKGGP